MTEQRWHYFVGDIHGCYEEYKKLEGQIHRHAARHNKASLIVSVGDLVDRGPKSAEVVQHFRKGKEQGTHTAVLGNHEAFMLQTLWEFCPWDAKESPFPEHLSSIWQRHQEGEGAAQVLQWDDYRIYCKCIWLMQGGHETLLSFGCDPHRPASWTLAKEDIRFLAQLPMYWESEQYVVTHAMAHPEELAFVKEYQQREETGDPVLRTAYQEACYQLLWQRELPEEAPDPERTHISGHTTFGRIQRMRSKQIIRIDTACVYGERLTAWCGETNTFFRTPALLHRD